MIFFKYSLIISMMIYRHAHKLIFTSSRSRDFSCKISNNFTLIQYLLNDLSKQKIYSQFNISFFLSLTTLAIQSILIDDFFLTHHWSILFDTLREILLIETSFVFDSAGNSILRYNILVNEWMYIKYMNISMKISFDR